MSKKEDKGKVMIRNKKASFEYELLEQFDAGLKLTGTEIKSIRDHKASIAEAYCYMHEADVYIKNMHIAEYLQAGPANHEPRRERKLLLKKQEIEKIEKKLKDQGVTLIPTLLYISDRGWAKIKISLAKGKKVHDKRDSIKEKDFKRQMQRKME